MGLPLEGELGEEARKSTEVQLYRYRSHLRSQSEPSRPSVRRCPGCWAGAGPPQSLPESVAAFAAQCPKLWLWEE